MQTILFKTGHHTNVSLLSISKGLLRYGRARSRDAYPNVQNSNTVQEIWHTSMSNCLFYYFLFFDSSFYVSLKRCFHRNQITKNRKHMKKGIKTVSDD